MVTVVVIGYAITVLSHWPRFLLVITKATNLAGTDKEDMDIVNKIEIPKEGTRFLSTSHFKLGHEPQWLASRNPAAFRSTFKNDYPPQVSGEREKTTLLPPAKIMHRDARIGGNHLSMTRDHYVPHPLHATGYQNMPYALSKTNFKMDSDKQVNSFRTTHNEHYYEKSLKDARNASLRTDWTKSCIPQGDRDKIGWEESAYKSSFVPFGASLKPIKHSGAFKGPKTIQGDARLHESSLYRTTNNDFYGNKYQRKVDVDESIRYPATNIPQGDREKCVYFESTQREDFGPPEVDKEPEDRSSGLVKRRSTGFRMGDHRLDSYNTTTHDAYQKVSIEGGRNNIIKRPEGKSNFLEGEIDSLKNIERFSTTTNSSQFKPPPLDFANPKVDGSKLRTASKVHLGNDDQLNSYNTTMKDNFKVQKGSIEKPIGDVHSSSIPTDYYKNYVEVPTYRTDFKGNEMAKLALDPAVVAKLKKSSVYITDPSFMEYSTTHKSTYTPKENSRERVNETGKLQKSSVPIGTMQSNCS